MAGDCVAPHVLEVERDWDAVTVDKRTPAAPGSARAEVEVDRHLV